MRQRAAVSRKPSGPTLTRDDASARRAGIWSRVPFLPWSGSPRSPRQPWQKTFLRRRPRCPPGTFTTSAHSDEWKIANALSAGPASITEHAAVIDRPTNPNDGMSNGRVLRQGTNGWTCMPDVPGRPQHDPMCADETMMKWLMATLTGKKPDIDRVGLSYMLMGEARQGQGATPAKDPSQVKEWFYVGPHVMVVLPDSAKDALRGVNQDLSNNEPYISLLSSAEVATPLWVIPVAKGGDRIKEEPAK